MKVAIYIFSFLMIFGTLEAKFPSVVKLSLSNDASVPQTREGLVFGVDSSATDSIDAALGEKEVPSIPLPEGVFWGYLEWKDLRQNGLVWSEKQFRPIPDSPLFSYSYKLKFAFGEGTKVKVKWDMAKDDIDSAFVTDITGGLGFKVNMIDKSEIEISNIAVRELLFNIWYSKGGTGVSEKNQSGAVIFPNPFENQINIVNIELYDEIVLCNALGTEARLKGGNSTIDVSMLPRGLYIAKLMKGGSTVATQKLIKK